MEGKKSAPQKITAVTLSAPFYRADRKTYRDDLKRRLQGKIFPIFDLYSDSKSPPNSKQTTSRCAGSPSRRDVVFVISDRFALLLFSSFFIRGCH